MNFHGCREKIFMKLLWTFQRNARMNSRTSENVVKHHKRTENSMEKVELFSKTIVINNSKSMV